jgi:hypothetical protein
MGGNYGYIRNTAGAPTKTLKRFSGKERKATIIRARLAATKQKGKRYNMAKKTGSY